MRRKIQYSWSKLLTILIFSSIPTFALAHNSLSARYFLNVKDSNATLKIDLSQEGISQTLLALYGHDGVLKMSQKDFKEAILKYVKEHFQLEVDGLAISIGSGAIRMDGHSTEMVFDLDSMPESIEQFTIFIPAFGENGHHQTLFSYDIDGKKGRTVLSHRNDYEAHFSLVEHRKDFASLILFGIPIVCVFAGIAVYRFRNEAKGSF